MQDYTFTPLQPAYFAGLAELQRIVYPTLGFDELMREEHFAAQYAIFPAGQFVVLHGDRVIGQGSGFFFDFDSNHPQHSFREICAGFTFAHHDPNGAYYYGADISVHPDYRGLGIGRLLYQARKDLVIRTHRRGIVAGGMIPDYPNYRAQMDVHEYVRRVVAGEIWDSTLSFQLKNGFVVRGMLEGYIDDTSADNWATLIVWENPHYRAAGG